MATITRREHKPVKSVNAIADSITNSSFNNRRTSKSTENIRKLNGRSVMKLKYRNPLKPRLSAQRSNSQTPPPALSATHSINSDLPDIIETTEEVDTMDFSLFINDIDKDIKSLNTADTNSDPHQFGSYNLGTDTFADLNLGTDYLGDLGLSPKSIFESHVIELDKIKKVSSPVPKKSAPSAKSSKSSAAPIPGSAAPIPNGAPMPASAPLPGSAPLPVSAPMLATNAAPMAAPMPAPMLSSAAPMPAATPTRNRSKVQFSNAEKQNISNAKSQFSSATGAVPLLMQQGTINENVRPEDYDKIADVAYNKDSGQYESSELDASSKVSKFSGLQSTKKIVSKTKEEEEYLSKAKGKVTKFSGLSQKSRKIVTADEEEQRRIADSKLVQKQKSLFNSKGNDTSLKRKVTVIDKNVTDAAAKAKNMFKAMEKKNTMKDVRSKSKKKKARKSFKLVEE